MSYTAEHVGSLCRQVTSEGSVDKETSERKVLFFEMLPDRYTILPRKYPPRWARMSIGIPPKESDEPIRIAFFKRIHGDSIMHGTLDALAAPPGSEAKVVRAQISSVQRRKKEKGVRTLICLSIHSNDIKRFPGLYVSPREIIDKDLEKTILSALNAEKLVFEIDSSTEELAANARRNALLNCRGEPAAALRARLQTSE